MHRYLAIALGFVVGICEKILEQDKPLDFGKHGVLIRREDDSLTPMTDDELWDMMDDAAAIEDEQEDWWLMTFAKAAQQYGEGIYLEN